METYQQSEESQSKQELISCVECNAPHDAKHLFVHTMMDLTRINSAIVTLDNLSHFAYCAKCRESGENTTLAWAIANFEAEQLVSCFSCANNNKETLMPRRAARAPGWVGCNILKGHRLSLSEAEMLVALQNTNRNSILYIDSKELLKPGAKDGFALCRECEFNVVSDFKKLGYKYDVPKDTIYKRIRSESLMYMLCGVRAKEERDSRNYRNR
jgi:hypothetical protein